MPEITKNLIDRLELGTATLLKVHSPIFFKI